MAGTTRKFIITKGNTAQFEWGFHISNTVAGRLRHDWWDSVGATMSNEFVDSALTANVWNLVAESSLAPVFNQRFSLFANSGTAAASTQGTTANVAYTNGTASVCIGNREDNPASQQWNGGIAQPMIFSGQLSAANVARLRNWFLAQGWSV